MASFTKYPMPAALATAFTPAEADELRANFGKFDNNGDGYIDALELASILGLVGEAATPDAVAKLLQDADTDNDGKISFDEFVNMMHKNKTSGSPSGLSNVIKKAVKVIRTTGAGGAQHTFSEEEKVAFSTHINNCLAGDELMARHLPLDVENDDLFTKGTDGIMYCKLINLAVSQTVDERALNKKANPSIYQKIENLNLALNAAKGIGCQIVNIGAQDLIEGRPILVLGILWQIIKIQLMSQISLKEHPELVLLLEPGEDLAAFMKLPPEDILIRWVNYHLKAANSSRRITNFTTDVKDSEIYSVLTHQLDAGKCSVAPADGVPTARAAHVIRNAHNLGASPFIQPKDIVDGNKKLNLSFVAQIFNVCPGLHITEEKKAEYDLFNVDIDDAGDSREERVFRMWMNSLNIEDMYINNLFYDLQDGVNLLRVFDKVVPGCVNWKRVNKNPTMVFKKVENCNYAVAIARDDFKFSVVNIGGTDICDGKKKLILAVIWQTMRKYTLQVLADIARSQGISTGEFNDDNIVQWANTRVSTSGKGVTMRSLRDPSLSNSIFFLTLVHVIEPRAVDWDAVVMNPAAGSEDAMNNARYVISCARKLGACVFLTPEDICEVKQKMILTFVAAIWQAELVRTGTVTKTPSAAAIASAISTSAAAGAGGAAVSASSSAAGSASSTPSAGKYNKDGTLASASPATPKFGFASSGTPTGSKYNKDGTPVAAGARPPSKWGTPGVSSK